MSGRWVVAIGLAAGIALVLVLALRTSETKPVKKAEAPVAQAKSERRSRSSRRPPLRTAEERPTVEASAQTGARPRIERLADVVRDKAIRSDWVTIDDHDRPCPPDRVRIVYDAPTELDQYTKGAYFEPLGPAPSDSTDEINGLLLCEGSTYLYRGFEAYWRADRQDWDVYPFPVVE